MMRRLWRVPRHARPPAPRRTTRRSNTSRASFGGKRTARSGRPSLGATFWSACTRTRRRSPWWTRRSRSANRSRWFRAACSRSCSRHGAPRTVRPFGRTSSLSTTSSPNTRTLSSRTCRSRAGTGSCTGCDERVARSESAHDSIVVPNLRSLATLLVCLKGLTRPVPHGYKLGHRSPIRKLRRSVRHHRPPALRAERPSQLAVLEQILGLVRPSHRGELRAPHEVEPHHRGARG
mmetsp:Transcript_14139/g.57524  ORF Transcript_14139/g.57524 Transcript_14139/m.57524 type:complete len:234 (+) Transcript_14139:3-704(+)